MTRPTFIYFPLLIATALATVSCSSNEGQRTQPFAHNNILSEVKAHRDSISYSISSTDFLTDLKKVMANVNDTISLLIPQRTPYLKSYPCTHCHNKPLAILQAQPEEKKKAHWNISIQHAPSETMKCSTCHDTQQFDQLHSLTGSSISFDQSFKTCAQCHSTQYKDWIGGAHGKRLGGWAPPRTIQGCVNCHNPHAPAFESRWPARLNTAKAPKLNPETTSDSPAH